MVRGWGLGAGSQKEDLTQEESGDKGITEEWARGLLTTKPLDETMPEASRTLSELSNDQLFQLSPRAS